MNDWLAENACSCQFADLHLGSKDSHWMVDQRVDDSSNCNNGEGRKREKSKANKPNKGTHGYRFRQMQHWRGESTYRWEFHRQCRTVLSGSAERSDSFRCTLPSLAQIRKWKRHRVIDLPSSHQRCCQSLSCSESRKTGSFEFPVNFSL